jgi:hypothetical protein
MQHRRGGMQGDDVGGHIRAAVIADMASEAQGACKGRSAARAPAQPVMSPAIPQTRYPNLLPIRDRIGPATTGITGRSAQNSGRLTPDFLRKITIPFAARIFSCHSLRFAPV